MSCRTGVWRCALLLAALWSATIGFHSVTTAFSTTARHRPVGWISRRTTPSLSSSLSTTTRLKAENDESSDRSEGLRQALSGVGQLFQKDTAVRVGSTVVANTNVPALEIWQFQSYTVEAIWDQGVPSSTNTTILEKIPCDTLDAPSPTGGSSHTRYVSLYSAKHHEQAVTVEYYPGNEAQLVRLRDEVLGSVRMALPLFGFWTALAYSFAAKYNERYGGDFMDALFRSKGL
eukprot:scaffold2987_cov170-Amphora_coffeaeformis.AAC.32